MDGNPQACDLRLWGNEATVRTMSDKDKIQKLENEVFLLKTKIKVLRERNKELRQWIVKLTNKDHPARKSAK
jgi:hypothetical protein